VPARSATDRHSSGRIPSRDAAGLPARTAQGVPKELQVGGGAR
jgi:hypothetical protein